MTTTVNRFLGIYWFLSNFYPAAITFEGDIYPTVEHAYQAAKTLDEGERRFIRSAGPPGKAKRAGRKLALRPDWLDLRYQIMYGLVRQKFNWHPDLMDRLRQTEDATLIEGNSWGDTYWGISNGVGENNLGKILMAIRSEIKEQQ